MSTVRIQVRRGLSSEWTAANPVLAAGEMGVETNTNKFKFGNGTDAWTALSYAASDAAAIGEISQDAINQALSVGAGLTKTYNDGANTITVTVDTDVVSTKTFAIAEATSKAAAAQAAAASYTDTAVSGINNSLTDYLEVADRGVANGVASLNNLGKVPEAQLNLQSLSTNVITSGNVTAENVTVNANLIVNGTTTTLNTQNVSIEDTLLYIAENNNSSSLDLGFVAGHNTGVYNHTGLVRDASDNKWKLFKDVTDEPTTTINFAQANLDNLALFNLDSNAIQAVSITATGTAALPNSSITTANIQSQAVTAEKLATDSVETAKIKNGAVTGAKLEDMTVTAAKLGAYAVTSGKIEDGSVITGKLGAASVTEDKIATNAVTEVKIAAGAVVETKLASGSVTLAKLASASVDSSKLAAGSVTSAKIADNSIVLAHMTDNSVGTVEIVDSAITEAKLAAAAVGSTKIATGAVSNAHIAADAAIATSKISGLDTALGLRAPLASPTFTGTVVLPSTTSIGNVSSTELGYVDGVTSPIQTQLAAGTTALANHEADTTNIHGISDTSLLATTANVATAKSEAITAAGTAADTKVSTAVAALTKSSVGLANVDNTADTAKPVSTAQATAIATAKSEAIASATASVTAVINGAPAAFDTLKEIADYIATDQSAGSALTASVATKAPLASPTFTGTVTVGAAGIVFSDGTQTRAAVPSITTFASSFAASATLAAGEQDKFVPVDGAVVITLPATGYSTGQSIDFYQASGTGASFASTNSVVGTPGLKFRTTNSVVTAMKTSSGWLVFGDLSA
jgi:hypothetical protein